MFDMRKKMEAPECLGSLTLSDKMGHIQGGKATDKERRAKGRRNGRNGHHSDGV